MKTYFQKGLGSNTIKNEWNKILKIEEKIDRKNITYKTNRYTFNFKQFETIRSFCDSIFTAKTIVGEADKKKENILEFSNSAKTKAAPDKKIKRNLWKHKWTLSK